MNFKARIENYILRHHLLKEDGKYLIALSGGADSVSLLLILKELGYHIEACHCNFHLRGEESNRDEAFCVALCQRLDIPFHRIHFDTKEYAALHKQSIEMAARELRYRYFEQLRQDLEADGICVAHHRDDSVETVLINLIRGTGINGLKGISPRNGKILRPLLCMDRKDILEYLKKKGQDYVTDSTNLVDDVVRNKIRLNILPMLKEINPSVCANIATTAEHVAEASKMLDGMSHIASTHEDGSVTIDKDRLMEQASPEYVLFANLSSFGFTGDVIQQILDSINAIGKTWQSATHQLVIDRDCIFIKVKLENDFHPIRIPESGSYVYHEVDGSEQKIKVSLMKKSDDFKPSKEARHVTLDAQMVKFPLTLRGIEKGDRFHPFGMKGSKLVSDYLTDRKKNLFDKQVQRVLVDAQGIILWLVGERTSDDCKITSDSTEVLDISC